MATIAVGTSEGALVDVPLEPSSLTWGLQDVSASDAGRVQDAGNTMYKMRTSQKRKLQITWTMPTADQAARILQMFNPEYFYVRYYDPMDGIWETRQFYAGDRSAPFKWIDVMDGTRFSTLTFDIIER